MNKLNKLEKIGLTALVLVMISAFSLMTVNQLKEYKEVTKQGELGNIGTSVSISQMGTGTSTIVTVSPSGTSTPVATGQYNSRYTVPEFPTEVIASSSLTSLIETGDVLDVVIYASSTAATTCNLTLETSMNKVDFYAERAEVKTSSTVFTVGATPLVHVIAIGTDVTKINLSVTPTSARWLRSTIGSCIATTTFHQGVNSRNRR